MKKIMTSLLVLAMLVCCLSISAFADYRAVFSIEEDSYTVKAGDQITINVNISENRGIAAGKVCLSCDKITFKNIRQGDWATDEFGDKIGSPWVNAEQGLYNWFLTEEVAADGIYCIYIGTVDADAEPGDYDITLTVVDLAGVDENGTTVSYNDENDIQTDTATLKIEGDPVIVDPPKTELKITKDPADVTVEEGQKAAFTVEAEGEGLTYQWQTTQGEADWANVEGATSATYELTAALADNGNQYRVVVTDKDGVEAISAEAKLTVTEKQVEPTPGPGPIDDPDPTPVEKKELKITTEPADVKVKEDEKATFTVVAEGEKVTYQWQKYDASSKTWKDIEGATDASYVIEKAAYADNETYYRVILKDEDGKSLKSKNVKLTVEKKADETTKPADKPKDNTAKTGDSTNLYIYMALCMFAAAVIVGVSYELKKNRE
jgi:hypothetical protein